VGTSILGTRVVRLEDRRLLVGAARHVDELGDEPLLTGALHVAFVRSPLPHGIIRSIDTSRARSMPGIVAVLVAGDLGLPREVSNFNRNVSRSVLADDRVRYVGEPVAVVVGTAPALVADAVDTVELDIDPLAAVVDPLVALESDTLLYPELDSNVAYGSVAAGLPGFTGDEFFADCDVVVRGRFVNQRVAPCPLEVRGSAAVWHDGRLHQWISTQHAHGVRDQLASIHGLDASAVHVVTPDVGGGFGSKITAYPEELALGAIARVVGAPVTWRETRTESMLALGHGRAQIQDVVVGARRDGRILAYRLDIVQDCGAFADIGTVLARGTRNMSSGVYAIPRIEARVRSVLTNTTPIVAYRGAGRPEATAAIERTMDLVAHELGMDPVEVRRRNLITAFREPHRTAIGAEYDVGDYAGALDRVLAAANYDELRREQRERRERGDDVLLGIGVSVYVEITSGGTTHEDARITVHPDGSATIATGTSPHGQGHHTAWAMIASERTGIPIERISLVWGDTDVVAEGLGTYGSRSLQLGGSAVQHTADRLVDLAREHAARRLEADVEDVVCDATSGTFHVRGTPSVHVGWAEVARSVDASRGIECERRFTSGGPTFPFGAHVAVVEVNKRTGAVHHRRHFACDDAGTIINPLLLTGQVHGGIAQGTAQALLEEVIYDADGTPKTTNLVDYAFITASEMPRITTVRMETPTPRNPLGAKGIGESGTIGSTPAVQSAVIDALSHLDVRHIDMPLTPERVWTAITATRPEA
jgi:carbon-monoxide dehydrogenase large subunit